MKYLLIFLTLFFLLLTINPASSQDINIVVDNPVSEAFTYTTPRVPQYTNPCTVTYPYYTLYFNVDYGAPQYSSLIVAPSHWAGTTTINSRYDTNVTLKIGAAVVGYGMFGFTKNFDGTYTVQLWINEFDSTGYSGYQIVSIYDYAYPTDVKVSHSDVAPGVLADVVFFINFASTCGGANNFLIGTYNTQWIKHWENTISYFDNTTYYYLELDRSTTYTSQAIIDQQGGIELLHESAQSGTDIYVVNGSTSFNTWNYAINDTDGVWHNGSIQFRPDESTTTGSLTFDKSNYTYPDGIKLTSSLTNADYDTYFYTLQIISDDASDFSSSQTVKSLSISEDTAATWISPDEIITNRPYYLMGIMREIRKSDGTIRYLDNETAYYSDPIGGTGGRIWTDKDAYLDGEDVLISYLTYETENYIAIEGPHELDYLGSGVPGVEGVKIKNLRTGSYGNWTVYLYENGDRVNTTTFYVTSNEIFCTWDDESIALGQLADFGYFSANASAQIRAFDGADNLVYGPATTQVGYHGGLVNTAGTEPGNWTISMYHNGSYYNDTLEVVSTTPWLRFLSNQYKVGDTIQIEYYLTDSRNSFTLYDSRMTNILTWTTTRGAVVVGKRNTVNFTLSDDNEYRIPVASKIDADQYALGFWHVEMFENVYGPPNPNLQQIDTTKILPAATDSTYASEQMFNTMFSVEGLFYIFACVMVLMGTKIANHPAGGAAGGIASTAFGAFFGIVPTWILYLMVIALVVLAGITAAAYFRK